MSNKITSIRGMNDVLPEQTPLWQWLEQRARAVLAAYGYQEIRLPIVERTELFARGIGEVTDIVEKEMYTFADRNDDSLTLRPEGTAGCVRAAEQHGLLYNQTQRLWYTGPMFRYERPQAGRSRQFHQIGVETFGIATPDIDAEVILLTARLWKELGLSDQVTLELNTLGDNDDRARYREALVAFLREHRDRLDRRDQTCRSCKLISREPPGRRRRLRAPSSSGSSSPRAAPCARSGPAAWPRGARRARRPPPACPAPSCRGTAIPCRGPAAPTPPARRASRRAAP